MLTDERIETIFKGVDSEDRGRFAIVRLFARAIEAEVRKDDEALIRRMLYALEEAHTIREDLQDEKARRQVITAARARLAVAATAKKGN